jgi:hypothetical protein
LGPYNFTANIRGGTPVSFDIILVDARILTSEVKLAFSPRYENLRHHVLIIKRFITENDFALLKLDNLLSAKAQLQLGANSFTDFHSKIHFGFLNNITDLTTKAIYSNEKSLNHHITQVSIFKIHVITQLGFRSDWIPCSG